MQTSKYITSSFSDFQDGKIIRISSANSSERVKQRCYNNVAAMAVHMWNKLVEIKPRFHCKSGNEPGVNSRPVRGGEIELKYEETRKKKAF